MRTKLLWHAVLSAVVLCGCATSQHRALRQNKEIIQRYFDGWANHGDTAVADELIATNVVLRNPPAVLHNLEEYKKGMAIFHTAFPDLHYTVEDLVGEGDKIVVRWTLHGTHRGDYPGRPPTGKTMTITGVSIFRLATGKIQDIQVNMDRLGMQQQLGWLPASPQPAK
jgi:steroid delta-isomerase-like uncharacterized protein